MIRKVAATLVLAGALGIAPAYAGDPAMEAHPPKTDISALPPVGDTWKDSNPYRGNAAVVETGRALFNESCAVCHGTDINHRNQVGPDLLRLHRGCRKVTEPELLSRCLSDVDHYFVKTVRKGKRVLDVQHMPPWDKALTQEAIWAIKTFIEARIDEDGRIKAQQKSAAR